MDTIDNDRRKWLGFGAAALGLALLPNHAFASLTTPRRKFYGLKISIPVNF